MLMAVDHIGANRVPRCTKFMGDPDVHADGDGEAEDGESGEVGFVELENVFAVFAEGGPFFDVHVLLDSHAADHSVRGGWGDGGGGTGVGGGEGWLGRDEGKWWAGESEM